MMARLVSWGIERWRLIWHGGLRRRPIARVTFAIVCVAAATFVRVALGLISPDSAVFAPYYSATLVAALVGGAMAGCVAATLGGLVACWLFVPPEWTVAPFLIEQLVSIFLFVSSSVVIIAAAESYHKLLVRLREAEGTRQVLNYELAHRIKNTLANVQAIVYQTLKDEPDIQAKLSARIAALGNSSDLLIKSEWQSAAVRKILDSEFSPYDSSRFHLVGDDIELPPGIAIMVALIFHELTTNAVKYGALSKPEGHIYVSWKRLGARLDLEWRETGGPPSSPGLHEGFGSNLLRAGVKQLDGSFDMQFEPTGLRLKLSITVPLAGRSRDIAKEQLRSGISEPNLI